MMSANSTFGNNKNMKREDNSITKELVCIKYILLIIAAILLSILIETNGGAGIGSLIAIGAIVGILAFIKLIFSIPYDAPKTELKKGHAEDPN